MVGVPLPGAKHGAERDDTPTSVPLAQELSGARPGTIGGRVEIGQLLWPLHLDSPLKRAFNVPSLDLQRDGRDAVEDDADSAQAIRLASALMGGLSSNLGGLLAATTGTSECNIRRSIPVFRWAPRNLVRPSRRPLAMVPTSRRFLVVLGTNDFGPLRAAVHGQWSASAATARRARRRRWI